MIDVLLVLYLIFNLIVFLIYWLVMKQIELHDIRDLFKPENIKTFLILLLFGMPIFLYAIVVVIKDEWGNNERKNCFD